MDGIVKRLVNALRCIATAVGLEIHQRCINRVQVIRQIDPFGHVLIAAIAIGNQPDANFRCRLRRRHRRCDRPDFFLGGLDQAAHAAGRIQYEYHVDLRITVSRNVMVDRVVDRNVLGLELRVVHDRAHGQQKKGNAQYFGFHDQNPHWLNK